MATDNKFIDSIKFTEAFPLSNDKHLISFDGREEFKNLVIQYLLSKDYNEADSKKNASRFKLNCLVGGNGSGKTRILEALETLNLLNNKNSIRGFKTDMEILLENGKKYVRNKTREVEKEKPMGLVEGPEGNLGKYIYDYFSVLGNSSQYSVNAKLLKSGFRKFYVDMHKLFTNNKEIIGFTTYLGLGDNAILNLKFVINHNSYSPERSESIEDKTLHLVELAKEFGFSDIFVFIKYFKENIQIKRSTLGKSKGTKDEYFSLLVCLSVFLNLNDYHKKLIGGESMMITGRTTHNETKDVIEYWKILNSHRNNLKDDIFPIQNSLEVPKIKENIKNILDRLQKNYWGYSIEITEGNSDKDFFEKITEQFGAFNNLFLGSFFSVGLTFTDGEKEIVYTDFSDGEKVFTSRFINIYSTIVQKHKEGIVDFKVLIDEPDLHLHLDWQRQYIKKLIDVFSTLHEDISVHFIIATHSPFIISDIPNECIIKLDKGKQVPYEDNSFGANYIDLIQQGFFFDKDQPLMGEFAEQIIGNIAQKRRNEITNDEIIEGEELERIEKIEGEIGDQFLKNNLLYFKSGKKSDNNKSR